MLLDYVKAGPTRAGLFALRACARTGEPYRADDPRGSHARARANLYARICTTIDTTVYVRRCVARGFRAILGVAGDTHACAIGLGAATGEPAVNIGDLEHALENCAR